ncbi:core protein [Bodo saltans virus]|uniref:Core protein n=1 Tax=Bodo saltans virus TaxID=2024608 RepID=A0A2H4UUM7_9VIRU|nr:core protein [Bodo saltans virus]ATZ80574.1 core protein [Bodo saltans virus]
MEVQTRSRSNDRKTDDIEYYLVSGIPTQQIATIMRAEKKDEKEISATIEKIDESRHKIRKLIKKFVDKIEQKYGQLDVPELIKKGLKYADKYGFTPAEREAFKNHVLKGDTDRPYLPFQEMEYTDMSKFLGFSSVPGLMLDIKAQDQEILHEIAKLYELNKPLHAAIKTNISLYRDCAPEAVSGHFDDKKDNVNIFIHPLIAALFLPKIEIIEHRMLYSNIGRMVVHRAAPYLRKYAPKMGAAGSQLEIESDFKLSWDFARDPNALNHFNEESPIANLLKRYKVQIELYKNVLKLREGKYYSKNDFGTDDGVSGLINILNSYDWIYFDSPDLYNANDEGMILRKLLAVFSLRPTFTQLSSFLNRGGIMGYTNFGVSRMSFINTPIINIRLPVNVLGGGPSRSIRLSTAALSQNTFFIENKMIVPKNMTVIHSDKALFFYANRRYQSVNFTNLDLCFKYMSLPGTMTSVTNVNSTELIFDHTMNLGNRFFILRAVTVLNKLSNHPFASLGCSSIIVCQPDASVGRMQTTYLYYNPVAASIKFQHNNVFMRNDPISVMPDQSMDPTIPGFTETARKTGTIFIYAEK